MGTSIKGHSMTRGNEFTFPAEHGFSGSCGGQAVKGYMRGGHVKSMHGTAAPRKFPAGHPPKATTAHKTTPYAFAKGGKIHPHEVEHKDYNDRNGGSDAAVYPEVGTREKPAGYAKGHRIHKAKGGEIERETLHEPTGTPSEPYEASRGGRIGKAARHETHHKEKGHRGEHQRSHEHHGKAKQRDGHSTKHPFAYGGRMPGAVRGQHHRARMRSHLNPLVSAGAPVMRPPPVMPMGGAPPPMGGGAPPPPMGAAPPGMPGGMKRGGHRR